VVRVGFGLLKVVGGLGMGGLGGMEVGGLSGFGSLTNGYGGCLVRYCLGVGCVVVYELTVVV